MAHDLFQDYQPADQSSDEIIGPDGQLPQEYASLVNTLQNWTLDQYEERQDRADLALLSAGITFNVYSDDEGNERIFPFSLFPRIVGADEWDAVEAGLTQRLRALNMFLLDIYSDQRVLSDGIIPTEIVLGSPGYRKEMVGFQPPLGVYAHVAGCDLVRDEQRQFVVLEDNLRTPSGVSYVLENRTVMLRVVPDLFPRFGVRAVNDYPNQLLASLLSTRPPASSDTPRAVLLTPGIYNSAYFEHSFLSLQMGIPLVEGSDLIVGEDNFVYLRSTTGLERIDVIYRRIDDDFLDPEVFRPDSMLGVPGLMRAYLAGRVSLANAPGAGVADDKVVYRWVPDIIRYYLDEDPILPNVETYSAVIPAELDHICTHAAQLVIKPANESGGYGVLIGPQASQDELDHTLAQVRAEPRNWIAQPLLHFSTIPTLSNDRMRPRRADLRPFVLSGQDTYVIPGGLTRVALREGSYVVNSSQGGGSKDTWVLNREPG